MSESEKESKLEVCTCIDYYDALWEAYKYKLVGKFSIILGLLGGAGSLMAGTFIIPTSITTGICSMGVFFAGLSLEKFINENKQLCENNNSLANDKKELMKRLTEYHFPASNIPSIIESNNITPSDKAETNKAETNKSDKSDSTVTPLNFELYLNSIAPNAREPTNFTP